MGTELELDFNEKPICPYCGSAQEDAWEFDLSDGETIDEVECDVCGKDIVITGHVEITYSTKKP